MSNYYDHSQISVSLDNHPLSLIIFIFLVRPSQGKGIRLRQADERGADPLARPIDGFAPGLGAVQPEQLRTAVPQQRLARRPGILEPLRVEPEHAAGHPQFAVGREGQRRRVGRHDREAERDGEVSA